MQQQLQSNPAARPAALSGNAVRVSAATAGRAPADLPLPLGGLRTDRWTTAHLLLATVMGVLGVAATFDAWQDITHLFWKEPEYSHIVLAPVVAVWMIFVRRLRIRHCRPVGTGIGFLIAAFGWAVSSFGFYRGYQTLWHGGAVVVVLGCVLSVLGKHALFRFFPAVAVLIFMIPVPPHYRLKIAAPLQRWTAQISQAILEIFNVPVERSGSKLSINGVDVNIIEACNGLRMVFPLILISYAFSFGLPLRNSVRFLVLLASPLSAIFCNVLRILPTVWIYGYWSQDPDVNRRVGTIFHDYSNWVMLPISFLILLGIIKVLRWAMVPVMKYTLAS
jgi:exosortase